MGAKTRENYDSICDLLEGKLLGNFFSFLLCSPLMLHEENERKRDEQNFSVDFKWNKLNKVLLLITEEWQQKF
jgi:hypothetical protein